MLLFLLAICSCGQEDAGTVEEQLAKLESMRLAAVKIEKSLQEKKGNAYLETHDRYYREMNLRAETAMRFLEGISLEDRSKEDLEGLIEIADIAHDELMLITIAKTLFIRYADTKYEKSLIQLYFSNAYLIEPGEILNYVTIAIFPPDEQLYCYFMLSLGYAETGAYREARVYYRLATTLLDSIKADPELKNKVPLLYIAGLRMFIMSRIGELEEAYKVLRQARDEFSDERDKVQLGIYEKRLQVLGGKAINPSCDHVIGKGMPGNLSEQTGKVLLLDFFTWDCRTCNTDLPFLERLRERIDSDDFIIVGMTRYVGSYENKTGISEEEEAGYMKNHYYKKRNLTWPVAIGPALMYDYGIDSVPGYILIGKGGIVRDGYFNAGNFTYLERMIKALLAE